MLSCVQATNIGELTHIGWLYGLACRAEFNRYAGMGAHTPMTAHPEPCVPVKLSCTGACSSLLGQKRINLGLFMLFWDKSLSEWALTKSRSVYVQLFRLITGGYANDAFAMLVVMLVTKKSQYSSSCSLAIFKFFNLYYLCVCLYLKVWWAQAGKLVGFQL